MAGSKAVEVGQRIALRRDALRLSQSDVAGAMGHRMRAGRLQRYSREWLSGVESGKTEPSIGQFYELAAILQTSPAWILEGDASGDSEFVAAMRIYDGDLDERGRIVLLAHAEREAEQARMIRSAEEDIESSFRSLLERAEARGPEHVERLLELYRRQVASPVQESDEPGTVAAAPRRRRVAGGAK